MKCLFVNISAVVTSFKSSKFMEVNIKTSLVVLFVQLESVFFHWFDVDIEIGCYFPSLTFRFLLKCLILSIPCFVIFLQYDTFRYLRAVNLSAIISSDLSVIEWHL